MTETEVVRKLVGEVLDFQDSFNRAYILAPQRDVAVGEFEPLMRPFRWWQDGHTFASYEHVLRAVIVPLSQVVTVLMTTGKKGEVLNILKVVQFLQKYQAGELSIEPALDPLDSIYEASRKALKVWPLDGLPKPPAELQAFQDGWKGILPDEVLDADAQTVVSALEKSSAALRQTKQTTYNVVRTCGSRHLDFFEEELHGLLPADQVLFLHGLDAFPEDDAVVSFLESFAEKSRYDHVRDKAHEYAKRVASGMDTSGFEP